MTQEELNVKTNLNQLIKEQNEVQFLKINRYQTQQNAIFIDYQPQKLISTINDYHNLKFYHRLSLSKNIQAIQDIIKDKTIIYQLLSELSMDHQDIQAQLILFYKRVTNRACPSDPKLYILTPLITLVKGTHLQIKQQASSIISQVKHWFSSEQKRQIIKIAIEMSHNNDQESKIVSIQLIVRMTPDLAHDENQRFFLDDYTKLYNDSSVRVKKQIITELKVLGENVSQEFFQKHMIDNFYLQKCLEKVWGVRKACVQIISELIKITQNKKQALAQALITFTKDGNKIVKVSAFKVIPQFLANYQAEQMPAKLMDLYLKIIDHQVNSLVSRQNQILNKVAYFFPGVLQRAGKKSWDQMGKLFQRLLHHKNQEVKKPLASSLHEISLIIGPQLSKQHMFTALDTILKDKSDSLKLDAIDHLSDFVKLFDTTTRENLIDVFLVLQKDPKKWRVRYSIAHQLQYLSKIYECQTVFKYIFPISLKLCNDNVYQVRSQAANQIHHVISSLKEIQIYEQMAIESIKGFGLSEKYIQRQTFSKMIENLNKLDNFEEHFIDVIQVLAKDPIIIVRIALAISLAKPSHQHATNQRILKVLNQLKTTQQIAEYLIEQKQDIIK